MRRYACWVRSTHQCRQRLRHNVVMDSDLCRHGPRQRLPPHVLLFHGGQGQLRNGSVFQHLGCSSENQLLCPANHACTSPLTQPLLSGHLHSSFCGNLNRTRHHDNFHIRNRNGISVWSKHAHKHRTPRLYRHPSRHSCRVGRRHTGDSRPFVLVLEVARGTKSRPSSRGEGRQRAVRRVRSYYGIFLDASA